MSSNRDRLTFQFADLKPSKTSAMAFAKIASDFIHTYHGNKYCDALLSAIISHLLENDSALTEEILRALETSLSERQNALLQEVREKEKRPKKWAPRTSAAALLNESSDEEGAEVDDEEERQKAVEAQRQQELEWQKAEERYEALQRQKEENEARLAAKARHVDTKALEEKLKSSGAVLLNVGVGSTKKNAKQSGAAGAQLSVEEVEKLHQNVATITMEKERLKMVLGTSDDELSARMEELKQELEAKMKQEPPLSNISEKPPLNKAQIVQLQQKLSKQVIEKNRLALQLKAMDANSQREEFLHMLEKRDAIALQLEFPMDLN